MIKGSILSDSLKDFHNISKLVLPLGGINTDYTIKQTNLNLLDIIKNNCITTIYTGNANKELKDLCKTYHITLYEMLKNPNFVADNALLTAKGLLYFLHRDVVEISDLSVLLIGYGNIGYYLAKLLKALRVDFDIYTEDDKEKKYILLEGYNHVQPIEGEYDLIINTIPKNIDLDYEGIKHSRVIDVASAPYGFDIDKIMQYEINYEIISAIPSKFAPYSAAKLINIFIENFK